MVCHSFCPFLFVLNIFFNKLCTHSSKSRVFKTDSRSSKFRALRRRATLAPVVASARLRYAINNCRSKSKQLG